MVLCQILSLESGVEDTHKEDRVHCARFHEQREYLHRWGIPSALRSARTLTQEFSMPPGAETRYIVSCEMTVEAPIRAYQAFWPINTVAIRFDTKDRSADIPP